MRLSDFENEDAIDLLADILEPVAKIMADGEIEKLWKSGKPKILLVRYALKNHKDSVIEIIAAMNGEKPDSYTFNIISLTRDLLDLLNDPELVAVFQSQSQKRPEEYSGSATESTKGEEK